MVNENIINQNCETTKVKPEKEEEKEIFYHCSDSVNNRDFVKTGRLRVLYKFIIIELKWQSRDAKTFLLHKNNEKPSKKI